MQNFIRYTLTSGALALSMANAAFSQEPQRVVADILPVHSLVSHVMEGAGLPELLLDPGTDPHTQSMRPSQAAALENADVVFVIGPALTPWLAKPLDVLASEATVVTLLDVEGTGLLEYRGEHSHGHTEEHGDEDHDEALQIDPHAWLDPANALVWLPAIAETLARSDPDRADLYRRNATAAVQRMSELDADVRAALEDVGRYGVHHDAYQYFEARFGLEPDFVVKEDDVHQPGPARIAEFRAQIVENPVACVFVEPLINRGLVETLLQDSDAKILELDPMGIALEPGPGLYPQVIRDLMNSMEQCH